MEFFTQLEFNPNLVYAVCRDIIETAVQPPCGHVFCLDCLLAWTDYQIPQSILKSSQNLIYSLYYLKKKLQLNS